MIKRKRYYSDGKKHPPFWMFIVPVTMFLMSLPYMMGRNPLLVVITFAFLGITAISASLYPLYRGFKVNRYLERNNLQLWKKLKSHSLKDRMDASREVKSLITQTPHLERYLKIGNKIAFALFTIWTIIFIGIFSYIIFSGL